jgi:hypothetical protein
VSFSLKNRVNGYLRCLEADPLRSGSVSARAGRTWGSQARKGARAVTARRGPAPRASRVSSLWVRGAAGGMGAALLGGRRQARPPGPTAPGVRAGWNMAGALTRALGQHEGRERTRGMFGQGHRGWCYPTSRAAPALHPVPPPLSAPRKGASVLRPSWAASFPSGRGT